MHACMCVCVYVCVCVTFFRSLSLFPSVSLSARFAHCPGSNCFDFTPEQKTPWFCINLSLSFLHPFGFYVFSCFAFSFMFFDLFRCNYASLKEVVSVRLVRMVHMVIRVLECWEKILGGIFFCWEIKQIQM